MNSTGDDRDDGKDDPEYMLLTGRDDAYPDPKGAMAYLDRHPDSDGASWVIHTLGKRLVRWTPTHGEQQLLEPLDGLFQIFNSRNSFHRRDAADEILYILRTDHPLGADLKGHIRSKAHELAQGLRSVFMGLTEDEQRTIASRIDRGLNPRANDALSNDVRYRGLIGEILWEIRDSLDVGVLATVSDVITSAYFHPKDLGIIDLVRLAVSRGGPAAAKIRSFVLARNWHPSIRQSLEAVQTPPAQG